MGLLRLDIAVGSRGITAVTPGRDTVISLDARVESGVASSALLSAAFNLLQEALEADADVASKLSGQVVARVALLPPLCETRLVDLPGLRGEEIEQVLRRDASRHFLGGTRFPVVGAVRVTGPKGLADPVLATAAPNSLLEALRNAVEIRGWELESIVPAHASWWRLLESSTNRRSGNRRSQLQESSTERRTGNRRSTVVARAVVAVVDDTSHVIVFAADGGSHIRRVPAGDTAGLTDVLGDTPGTLLVLANEPERAAILDSARHAGWVLAQHPGSSDAAEAAARTAGDALPEIVPESLALKRRSKARGLTSRLLVAAVGVLLIAAGVHYWGTARAYGEARRQREEIRGEVAPVLANRDSLDRLTARMDDLAALEAQSSGWTASLVELSVLLPPETYLLSLRASADTVVLEAAGGRAGEALESLRASPLLREVQLEGPIQREMEGGTTARERFTISGIITPLTPEGPATADEVAGL